MTVFQSCSSKFIAIFLCVFIAGCSVNSPKDLPIQDSQQIDREPNGQRSSKNETLAPSILKNDTCEQLKVKATTDDYPLKQLAGIRAHRKCKKFQFKTDQLDSTERKIFQNELSLINVPFIEIDPIEQIEKNENIKKGEARKKLIEAQKNLKKTKIEIEKVAFHSKIQQYYKILSKKSEQIKTATEIYNISYKKMNDPQADPLLKKDFQNFLLDSGLFLVKNFWNSNNPNKALETINSMNRLLSEDVNLVEVYNLQARIHEELNHTEEASQSYQLALNETEKPNFKPLVITKDKILWQKAWLHYKNEQWDLAQKGFQALITATQDNTEKARSQFFLARTYLKTNQKSEYETLLKKLSSLDFFSYYSLLAYQELNEKIPAISSYKLTQKITLDDSLSFLDPKYKSIYLELLKNQETEIAEVAIAALANKKPEQVFLLSLELAKNCQFYLPLFSSFVKLTHEQKQDVIIKYGHIIFPKIHEDEVTKMSDKTQVPISLIYAIMKQESAFNPKTRSQANALGLMQVIPALAKQIARKYKIKYNSSKDLYSPSTNIQIGSYELFQQIKKQNNNYVFVAAAYNAGPNALSKWLKTKFKTHFDMIDFVEEIPYEETKLYVKIIARNQLFYERLAAPDKDHSFPENFVKKIEVVTQN